MAEIAVAFLAVADTLDKIINNTGSLEVNGHTIVYSIHGRFHTPFEWVWDCKATDVVTGKMGYSKRSKSKRGALGDALKVLAGK